VFSVSSHSPLPSYPLFSSPPHPSLTLSFACITTIKGGRHEVPETAPRQALEMFRRFIASEPF
jgi:hypothetical protein